MNVPGTARVIVPDLTMIPAVHLSAEKRTRRKFVFEKRDISEIHDT